MIWVYLINGVLLSCMFYEYARYAYRTNLFSEYLKNNNDVSSNIVINHLKTLKWAVIQCLLIHIISICGYVYLFSKIDNPNNIVLYGLYFVIILSFIHNFYVRKLNKERAELIKLEIIKISNVNQPSSYTEMNTLREALQCHINKLEGANKWTPS